MEKIVEISELSFTHPDGTVAIRDLHFSLFAGETVAILGANGAGKSTLLLHLNGVLRGKGQIKVFGERISKKNLRAIRSKVGIVFQDPNDQLFMPTVMEDIAFGPLNFGYSRTEVKEMVRETMVRLDIWEFRDKPFFHLSLGQKKRVALATVLVLQPEILVFDEPCASLDPGTRRKFIDMIKYVPCTKIIATHDLDLVSALCSRAVILDRGRVVASGGTKEIVTNTDLLKKYHLF